MSLLEWENTGSFPLRERLAACEPDSQKIQGLKVADWTT
jgi:hypothetical protein